MNKQPLFICFIFFSAGIILQDFYQLNEIWAGGVMIIGMILLCLDFFKNKILDKLKSAFLWIFFFGLGMVSHLFHSQHEVFQLPDNDKPQQITFRLNKKLNSNKKNKRYEVEVLNFNQTFSAVLSIPKEQRELDFLHLYSAKAYLHLTQKFEYDFLFDYQKYLARQNIYHQGYIPSEINIFKKESLSFQDQIQQRRLELLHKIDSSLLLPQNKALLKGIILADRTEIDRETIKNFSQTGLIHILAISGSHMAIIFLLILFFLKPFFSVRYKNIPIYISISAIWAFAIFIDFGNSVVRSCVMISTYYIMIFLQRKPDLPHSMALAGIIILTLDTQQIFNIGFQLSFLAVWGIHCFYQPIIKLFGKVKNGILRFTLNTFSLSLSAQLGVIPLTIYHFHQLSFLSVFINVVSIFFSQIFIIFSFIICILFNFNIAFNWILIIYDFTASVFLKMIAFFAHWDFSFVNKLPMNIPEVILLFVIFYFLQKILIKPNIKNTLHFTFFILLFCFTRLFINFYFWQKDEVLAHHYFKETLVSVKQKDKVIFFISEKTNIDRVTNNIINPYITSRRTNNLEIKKVPIGTKIIVQENLYEIK